MKKYENIRINSPNQVLTHAARAATRGARKAIKLRSVSTWLGEMFAH